MLWCNGKLQIYLINNSPYVYMHEIDKTDMKSRYLSLIGIILLSFPSSAFVWGRAGIDDRILAHSIFVNGNLLSLDENNTIYEGIAIANGQIVALGSTDEILDNYRTENLTYYDLKADTMMPGIIDGHSHYIASQIWQGGIASYYDAQELALSHGYTTITEKSIDLAELESFFLAEQNNELRLRFNLFPIHNYAFLDQNNETIIVNRWYRENGPILDPSRMLRIPGIKIYTDGYTGARGFPAMSEPFTQDMITLWGVGDPYGNLYLNQTEMNLAVSEIQNAGFSAAFHSMGDRAIETVLNAIKFAMNGSTNENYRHQIEHNSFIREDLITLAIELKSIHSVRGYFPTYFQRDYENFYPEHWLNWTVNRYTLPSRGLHTYLETDFNFISYVPDNLASTANIRPFFHLWGLVTRNAYDSNGQIHEPLPWLAKPQISVYEALRMMTFEGAYAVKQEEHLGTLEYGKLADMIIISDDPYNVDPRDLKDLENLLTMVGGKVEYQADSYILQQRQAEIQEEGPSIPGLTPQIMVLGLTATSIFLVIQQKSKKKFP